MNTDSADPFSGGIGKIGDAAVAISLMKISS